MGNPVLAIRKGNVVAGMVIHTCISIYATVCVCLCQPACVLPQVSLSLPLYLFLAVLAVCLSVCVGLLSSLPLIRTRHINLNIDYRLHACIVYAFCIHTYLHTYKRILMHVESFAGMCEGGFKSIRTLTTWTNVTCNCDDTWGSWIRPVSVIVMRPASITHCNDDELCNDSIRVELITLPYRYTVIQKTS